MPADVLRTVTKEWNVSFHALALCVIVRYCKCYTTTFCSLTMWHSLVTAACDSILVTLVPFTSVKCKQTGVNRTSDVFTYTEVCDNFETLIFYLRISSVCAI
jgi:hypothetical protein